MTTTFKSGAGVEYILRTITVAPYRKINSNDKQLMRREIYRHGSASLLLLEDNGFGGESCFGFEVYVREGTTISERIRHFLRKLETAALGYIHVNSVVIVIAV